MLTFEDFTPGDTSTFGHCPVTREAILEFAREFDPQPFHLDDAAAKRSLLGGLSASGWHTAGMLMRMIAQGFLNNSASLGAPGIRSVKWLKPVRPGDVLSARRTLLGKRISQSRPELGFLDWQFEVLNQHGEVVMTQENVIMVALRGASPVPVTVPPRLPLPVLPDAAPAKLSGWYEDMLEGESTALGTHVFERAGMIRFAEKFDPQPFHTSEEAARRSLFGGLSASGWHTAAVWMSLNIAARQRFDAIQTRVPEAGPSPGVSNLRWPKPVYAGDRLAYATQCTSKRLTSRPGWGLVMFKASGDNQAGQRVFEFDGAVFAAVRGEG